MKFGGGDTGIDGPTENDRATVVSFTTIPPRFERLPRKIQSIIEQKVMPDAIEIYIPKRYRRVPGRRPVFPRLPSAVQVIEVDEDLGPATKLLPALKKWETESVYFLVCGDDGVQYRNWISSRPRRIHLHTDDRLSGPFNTLDQAQPVRPARPHVLMSRKMCSTARRGKG